MSDTLERRLRLSGGAAITTDAQPGRIDDRQQHFLAATMLFAARVAQHSALVPETFAADLCGQLVAVRTAKLQWFISGQELDFAIRKYGRQISQYAPLQARG
jgi:hypothetical protein